MPQGQYTAGATTITVDYLLKNPQVLNRRFIQDLSQKGYITEALLQGGYPVVGGSIRYNRDESLFPDDESGRRTYEIVAEGARFPIIGPLEPTEQVEKSAKHGLRMFVTEEQRLRNQVPQVDKSLRYLKNELIDYVDNLFMQKFLTDPAIPTYSVTTDAAAHGFSNATWTSTANGLIKDIAILKSKLTGLRRGFRPDTLLVNDNKVPELLAHDKLFAAFANAGASSPIFTGQLPNQIMGLDVLYSPFVTSGTAIVMQRKMLGGYGDERPEQIRVLPFNEEREVYEIKASRMMLYFIDEPNAAVKLTGI